MKDRRDVDGSGLLEVGQWVIAGMRHTTGTDDPENGERFDQAATCFTEVGEVLASAFPNDSWSGSGADAYTDQNSRHRALTETMAEADRAVHRVLLREALQTISTRRQLDDQHTFLAEFSRATSPLQFVPRYGEAVKLAMELAALQKALAISSIKLHELQSQVAQNAAELQQAAGRYASVTEEAKPGSDPGG